MRSSTLAFVSCLCALVACSRPSEDKPSTPGASAASGAARAADPRSAEFKARVQARLDAMRQEERVREEAPWFGRTGLSDEDEREVPRYLRREYGKLLSEPGSLKAADLEYLGVFQEAGDTVHYWKIHDGSKKLPHAYFVSAPREHQVLGWGGREPPR